MKLCNECEQDYEDELGAILRYAGHTAVILAACLALVAGLPRVAGAIGIVLVAIRTIEAVGQYLTNEDAKRAGCDGCDHG